MCWLKITNFDRFFLNFFFAPSRLRNRARPRFSELAESSSGLLLELHELDDEVAGHAEAEDDDEDPELDVDADVRLEDVGEDEAEGLPQAVVGERGLLVLLEEHAVKG